MRRISTSEHPPGFYCKCRPRTADLWPFARSRNRVFVGYPPWSSADPADDGILDISAAGFDPKRGFPEADCHHTATNAGLASDIGPGSYVLVPRPGEGQCHIGLMDRPFELFLDGDYVEEAASLARSKGHDGSDRDIMGDVVQTWPVKAWQTVEFVHLPGWVRSSLRRSNTAGRIHHPDAWERVDQLFRTRTLGLSLDPTDDPDEILRRMRLFLTPTAFEHLVVSLLQLDNHQERWFHTGGPGDGGDDGQAVDRTGRFGAKLQCKLVWDGSRLDFTPQVGVRTYLAYLELRAGARPEIPGLIILSGLDVAHSLLRHKDRCPKAIALGIAE